MKIIKNPKLNYIGKQQIIDDKKYVLSQYTVVKKIDNYSILFNFMTDGCVILDPDDKTKEIKRYLIKNWFLVDENTNLFSKAKEIKESKISSIRNKPIENIRSYIILPTTDCNANCSYCFEVGSRKLKMTTKIADDVVNFIDRTYDKNKEEIKIRWFGGEPLYNSEIIDYIVNKLNERGIKFYSSIITNGYLISDEIVNKFNNLWNIRSCQITLDGIHDIYNDTKNYIYDTDCFEIVSNNIYRLLNNNVNVSIRLNSTENNTQDLLDTVDYLYETFGKRKNLTVYVFPVYQFFSEKPKLALDNSEIVQKRISQTFGWKRKLRSLLTDGTKCMANNARSIVINPLGKLSLCEHDVDRNQIGDIYTGINQEHELIKKYREYQYHEDLCPTCKLYPSCLMGKMCESDSNCSKEKIEFNLRRIIRSMNVLLRKHIREIQKKEEKQ